MDYIICPYNADHKVHGTELRMHLMTCENRKAEEQDRVVSQQTSKKKTKWMALSLKQEQEEEKRMLEEEMCIYDPQDQNSLLQCPYDSNHQIRPCRFPYHLIKCRKNHKDLDSQLVACPFNARHLVARGELSYHISRCNDQSCIEKDIADGRSMYRRDVSPSRWTSPPCNEDWDQELQGNMPTFVWGKPSYPVPSSGGGTLMDPKSILGSNLRAPKSLPYVLPWKVHKNA